MKNNPAFPVIGGHAENFGPFYGEDSEGISIRDYFAAKAIINHGCNMWDFKAIAEYSYMLADAMLKARSQS